MCDGYVERMYCMRKVEALRKEMEQEELERQRQAAAVPAKPVKPAAGAGQPESLPV